MCVSGSSLPPKTSVIRPSGFRPCSGHLIISTTTLSPIWAPLNSSFGTNTSLYIFLSSGTTNAKCLDVSNTPIMALLTLLSIRIISPSALLPSIIARVNRAIT